MWRIPLPRLSLSLSPSLFPSERSTLQYKCRDLITLIEAYRCSVAFFGAPDRLHCEAFLEVEVGGRRGLSGRNRRTGLLAARTHSFDSGRRNEHHRQVIISADIGEFLKRASFLKQSNDSRPVLADDVCPR